MDALPFAIQLLIMIVLMAGWPLYLFLQFESMRSGGLLTVVLTIAAWSAAAKIREYFAPLGPTISFGCFIAWAALPYILLLILLWQKRWKDTNPPR